MSLSELKEVIEIAEKHDVWLLIDETYRDMFKDEVLPVAASLSDKVISVSSLSKTYGIPGIRIGWTVCRNKKINDLLLCAKEQYASEEVWLMSILAMLLCLKKLNG